MQRPAACIHTLCSPLCRMLAHALSWRALASILALVQGDAAACVETEVIVTHGRRGTPVASHVQLSGTPPLRWGQVRGAGATCC